MIVECIKEGFKLTHKNSQLILLRIAVTGINLLSFLIFMGIPIFVAITHLGMDITHVKETLLYLFKNPFEIISKYLGLLFLIAAAFIFYLTFASFLFLYALSGTLGVLKNSALNMQYKFSLSSFFKEAKKRFYTLLWVISVLSLGFGAAFILIILLSGIVIAIQQSLIGTETSLGMFLNSFLTLSIIIFGIMTFLAAGIFIVYSIVISVIGEGGVMDSIKKTFNFLKDKPAAFLFFIIILFGFITAIFILLIIEIPFGMLPDKSPLITAAFYIINAVVQSYLSIVVWSSLIVFYIKGANYPVSCATYDI